MGLTDEKYLLLTTFKRNGDAVASPVWGTPINEGDIGFWTSSGSGKVKRLAHTAKITVQPCNARGRATAGTSPSPGTARVVSSGAEMDAIQAGIKAKYGFMTKVTKLLGTIGGIVKRKRIPYGDRGVVITITT